jgi:hypothetical protein
MVSAFGLIDVDMTDCAAPRDAPRLVVFSELLPQKVPQISFRVLDTPKPISQAH